MRTHFLSATFPLSGLKDYKMRLSRMQRLKIGAIVLPVADTRTSGFISAAIAFGEPRRW